MSYWKRVFWRVVREAARDAKLDTWASATIHLFVQAVSSIIIWVALSYVLAPGTLWARVLAAALPLIIFPIAMGVRFFTVPANLAREDQAQIKSLTAALETRERRKVAKTIIGRALEDGQRLLTRNADGTLGEKEPAEQWVATTWKFISAAFGPGEATLFLSDAGYVFYSSDGRVGALVKGRLRRLAELLGRVDVLDIDKDFDPASWP